MSYAQNWGFQASEILSGRVNGQRKTNLRDYFLRSAESAPEAASKWLNRFEAALQTLSTNPQRCRLAPENDVVSENIYEFLFGKRTGTFRVLFTIANSTVLILHIRRATMDIASEEDLYSN